MAKWSHIIKLFVQLDVYHSNTFNFISITLSEEVRAQQAAVDELAARLSSAEEPTAVHPGETGV